MNNHMRLTLVGKNSRIELNSRESSIYLQAELAGLSDLPKIRTTSGQNIGMDGGWTSTLLYEPRLISIKAVIANPSVQVVEQRRKQLIGLLAEKRLVLEFQTEAGNEYAVDVVVSGITMPIQQLLTASEFKLDLRADDPVIYDNTNGGKLGVTLVKSSGAATGFSINFPITFQLGEPESRPTVNNFGATDIFPTFTIYGPLSRPTVTNITTNSFFTIDRVLEADDVMVINTKDHTVILNGNDLYSSFSGDWMKLAIGKNMMELSTEESAEIDTGRVDVEYKVGYMGV